MPAARRWRAFATDAASSVVAASTTSHIRLAYWRATARGRRRRATADRKIELVDRPAGVGDDENAIAEIAAMAHGRLQRIVGQHAADDQRRRAERIEQAFETRATKALLRRLPITVSPSSGAARLETMTRRSGR